MHVPKHGSTQHVQRHHVDHVGLVFGMLSTIMLSCIWYARTSLASRSQLEGPSPRDGREGGEERRNARYTKWRAPAPRDHVASRSQHATRQTMQHRHQRNELLQLHTSSLTGHNSLHWPYPSIFRCRLDHISTHNKRRQMEGGKIATQ
jgi:hypothetical protein